MSAFLGIGKKSMGYTVLENWGYAKLILTEKWIKTAAGWRYAHREGEAGRVVRDDSMADADQLIG